MNFFLSRNLTLKWHRERYRIRYRENICKIFFFRFSNDTFDKIRLNCTQNYPYFQTLEAYFLNIDKLFATAIQNFRFLLNRNEYDRVDRFYFDCKPN